MTEPVNDTAWRAVDFADLPGWAADRHDEAFAAFLRSAAVMAARPPATGTLGISGGDLAEIGRRALALGPLGGDDARRFFEDHFAPWIHGGDGAFLTAYFEPELPAARTPTARFAVPLYAPPSDLVEIAPGSVAGLDPALAFARRLPEGGYAEHPDRAAIEDGALAGRGLELAFVEDPVDAFFVHVQGSARLSFEDGSVARIAYAGKTGHPYTSIGRRLAERGDAGPEPLTADRLAAWLKADRTAGRALMRENRSFIFFQVVPDLDPALGALAAAGAQLTPGRSLAVDRRIHTFGVPIYLCAELPFGPDGAPRRFDRLMIAQDTGSAIVGPARGDVFVGTGTAAGVAAGRVRHRPEAFVVLKPRTNR